MFFYLSGRLAQRIKREFDTISERRGKRIKETATSKYYGSKKIQLTANGKVIITDAKKEIARANDDLLAMVVNNSNFDAKYLTGIFFAKFFSIASMIESDLRKQKIKNDGRGRH